MILISVTLFNKLIKNFMLILNIPILKSIIKVN